MWFVDWETSKILVSHFSDTVLQATMRNCCTSVTTIISRVFVLCQMSAEHRKERGEQQVRNYDMKKRRKIRDKECCLGCLLLCSEYIRVNIILQKKRKWWEWEQTHKERKLLFGRPLKTQTKQKTKLCVFISCGSAQLWEPIVCNCGLHVDRFGFDWQLQLASQDLAHSSCPYLTKLSANVCFRGQVILVFVIRSNFTANHPKLHQSSATLWVFVCSVVLFFISQGNFSIRDSEEFHFGLSFLCLLSSDEQISQQEAACIVCVILSCLRGQNGCQFSKTILAVSAGSFFGEKSEGSIIYVGNEKLIGTKESKLLLHFGSLGNEYRKNKGRYKHEKLPCRCLRGAKPVTLATSRNVKTQRKITAGCIALH